MRLSNKAKRTKLTRQNFRLVERSSTNVSGRDRTQKFSNNFTFRFEISHAVYSTYAKAPILQVLRL
jgi:hypothetical protein